MQLQRRRRLIGTGVVTILLLLAGYLGGGILIYNRLTPVQAKCEAAYVKGYQSNTPANFKAVYGGVTTDTTAWLMPEYETVNFPARDEAGITIAGWFVPALHVDAPPTQPVIIIVHGIRGCRRDAGTLLPAGMLAHSGFNVLLIDLRNHGDSTVQDGHTSVGNREYRDVLGAWDWLQSDKGFAPDRIGVLGESLGAGTTAIAFGEEPALRAVWLDSPYADMPEVVRAELVRSGFPTFLAESAPLASQLTGGFNLYDKSPLLAMDQAAGRPVFITHGTADTRLSYTYSLDLIARIESHGGTVDRWIVDGAEHVQAIFLHPQIYEQKLVAFFEQALAQDEPVR